MNKKLIFQHIIQGLQATIKRFPIPVVIAILGTIITLFVLHKNDTESVSKLFYTIALAFPLSIATTLISERNNKMILNFSILGIFIIIYYFFIGKNLFTVDYDKFRMQYMLWILASAFLITFIPFIKKTTADVLDFWHYNQKILFAGLTTVFYTGTIYAGLSIALFSVNTLFDLNIDSIRWAELGTLIGGLFTTTFFLARFPQAKENKTDYPKELRIFTFYVLTPLVAIYFLILYSYSGKIIISQEWPKGIISSMILGFSMLGIFTYALAYPLILKDQLLQKISKGFFIALLPQIVVLFLAVKLRIDEYAMTESRYFVVVFGAWLLGMSLYFLISKPKNIQIIAVTLFALTALVSFGPWGAFQVSRDSQVNRLEGILINNNMLVDGKIASTTTQITFKDRQEISEIISYLNQNHGLETIQPWFDEELNNIKEPYLKVKRVAELLGINFIDRYQNEENYYFSTIQGKNTPILKVTGYDYLVNNTFSPDTQTSTVIKGVQYKFELATTTLEYIVYQNNTEIVRFSVKEFIDKLVADYRQTGKTEHTSDELSLDFENTKVKMIIYFSSINSSQGNIWTQQSVLLKLK
jgi:hypothetical protein